MNVLIVDTDKIKLDEADAMFKRCISKNESDDWLVIPKGFDILMDISVDWMRMIRDRLDEKIRELDGDNVCCPMCNADYQNITEENLMSNNKVVSVVYRCTQCKHVWEVDIDAEGINS